MYQVSSRRRENQDKRVVGRKRRLKTGKLSNPANQAVKLEIEEHAIS